MVLEKTKQLHLQQTVHAFLPNKSRATYNKLLHIILEKAQNLQLYFKPETVVADFEVAIKQNKFPNIYIIENAIIIFLPGSYERNLRHWAANPIQTKILNN